MRQRFIDHILLAVLLVAMQIPVAAHAALMKSEVFEKDVAYVRVTTVGKELPAEIQSAEKALTVSNKINGLIVDLRFADGDDLDSAKTVAASLIKNKEPLAILVNSETRGAAIKMAECLRTARAGLIFGNSSEITPDLTVAVKPAEERDFLENPYSVAAGTSTNSATGTNNFFSFVEHISEADLVRAKVKDGEEAENFQPIRATEPPKPTLRDPVLARAVDLVHGLAIFRTAHL